MNNLVPAICTQCGANLSVEPTQDAAICHYCGTPFIVKDAIQKYYISVNGMVHVENAVINNGPSAMNYVKRARQFEIEGQESVAIEYYNKALDLDADCMDAKNGLFKIKENHAITNVQEYIANNEFGRALLFLQDQKQKGIDTGKISEMISVLTQRNESFVFLSDEAYYRFSKLQLTATKGKLVVDSRTIEFSSPKGIIRLPLCDVKGAYAMEDVNYAGETFGRTEYNCVGISYTQQGKDKRIVFRVHKAQKIAMILGKAIRNNINFEAFVKSVKK